MATKAQKATTQSESPQQQTLPMQYDVRIHSLRLDGNCRAHASVHMHFSLHRRATAGTSTVFSRKCRSISPANIPP